MREMHSTTKLVHALDPAVTTEARTGTTVDRSGFEAVEHMVQVGLRGDVLSETRYFSLILEASADATTWVPVTEATEVIGQTVDANGVFKVVDSPETDRLTHRVGYLGGARYSRVSITVEGTHSVGTPIGALCLLGRPWVAPTT